MINPNEDLWLKAEDDCRKIWGTEMKNNKECWGKKCDFSWFNHPNDHI